MTAKNYKGILFDFDGVLADTMGDHYAAWNHALSFYNTTVLRENFFPLEGMPVALMAGEICKSAGISPSCSQELLKNKDEYYLKKSKTIFYPFVEEFIDLLHSRDIPMAIVSGGRYERIRYSTPPAFLEKFKALITAESTKRGKPHPDPYLEGARLLGLEAEDCIVVENAPLGIQSAKAAGACCLAVASTVERAKLQEADEIVDAFQDLCGLTSIRPFLT